MDSFCKRILQYKYELYLLVLKKQKLDLNYAYYQIGLNDL
jgi:hypothetical protein